MTTTYTTKTEVDTGTESNQLPRAVEKPRSTSTNLSWDRIDTETRSSLVWWIWALTWLGLVIGYVDRRGWNFVVEFSAIHALLFLALFEGQFTAFPVQVRIAYFLWVACGTFLPSPCEVLMHITLIGLFANITVGYCPLARMMSLLPWNRTVPLTWDLIYRTIVSPPTKGKFQVVKDETSKKST